MDAGSGARSSPGARHRGGAPRLFTEWATASDSDCSASWGGRRPTVHELCWEHQGEEHGAFWEFGPGPVRLRPGYVAPGMTVDLSETQPLYLQIREMERLCLFSELKGL